MKKIENYKNYDAEELNRIVKTLTEKLEVEKEKNEQLNRELAILKRSFNSQIEELKRNYEKKLTAKLNSIVLEKEKKTSKQEWEKIIDEMAHTVNSDVYVAVSYLSQLPQNQFTEIALAHTKQIRDLINLIMFYLKRNELKISGETESVSIEETVKLQISTIKKSLSTLRLPTEEHEENLAALEIDVKTEGNTFVAISKEIKDAVSLIIKDLLRNAFKNTDEENPQIGIEISGSNETVKLKIENNRTISDEFAKWFNGETESEPEISKSMKVGLRVIKKWVSELGVEAKLIPDKENNKTIATIIFPRGIYYEQKN